MAKPGVGVQVCQAPKPVLGATAVVVSPGWEINVWRYNCDIINSANCHWRRTGEVQLTRRGESAEKGGSVGMAVKTCFLEEATLGLEGAGFGQESSPGGRSSLRKGIEGRSSSVWPELKSGGRGERVASCLSGFREGAPPSMPFSSET